MHFAVLSTSLKAETIIIGSSSSVCLDLNSFNNSKPFMSGRMTSSKIRSGVFLSTSLRAFVPS